MIRTENDARLDLMSARMKLSFRAHIIGEQEKKIKEIQAENLRLKHQISRCQLENRDNGKSEQR